MGGDGDGGERSEVREAVTIGHARARNGGEVRPPDHGRPASQNATPPPSVHGRDQPRGHDPSDADKHDANHDGIITH